VPDSRQAVRRRLGPLSLDSARAGEIVAELADHVDDLAEEWLRRGVDAERAMALALRSIPDWDELRLEIERAEQEEDIMNHRIKALWLPGICTTILVMLWFQLTEWAWPLHHFLWSWRGVVFFLYWPWLLLLPAVGAMGAYWSRRAGARPAERAFVGVLPALGLIGFLTLLYISAWVLSLDEGRAHLPGLLPLALFVLSVGILPAAALLLGALPFLRSSPQETAREATTA
jgi:hypothetical protein